MFLQKDWITVDPMSATENLIWGEWIWSTDEGVSQDLNVWLGHNTIDGKFCMFLEHSDAIEGNGFY